MDELKPFAVSRSQTDYLIIMMFGGDNNLSHFVNEDLQEMAAGISGNITVLGLVDYNNKPASVVEVTAERGIQTLEEWGEIDTGDPDVLANFMARALMTYPGAKRALGFWDHGTGVFDETDASEIHLSRSLYSVARADRTRSYPARRLFFPKSLLAEDAVTRGMLHDDTNGGILTNLEAGKMIAAALGRAGNSDRLDLIFSDTCLNGMIEVLEELGPYAECIVGSPELEPGDGWNYQHWLRLVSAQPPATGLEWGQYAVDAFRTTYEPTPKKHPCTLGAFATEHQMTEAFRGLLDAARADQSPFDAFFVLDRARSKAQAYARRDSYCLVDFCQHVMSIAGQTKPALAAAAQVLIDAHAQAKVNTCRLGPTVSECHGLAFWFPSSASLMKREIGNYERLSFSRRTGWADYLREFR